MNDPIIETVHRENVNMHNGLPLTAALVALGKYDPCSPCYLRMKGTCDSDVRASCYHKQAYDEYQRLLAERGLT